MLPPPEQRRLAINLTPRNGLSVQLGPKDEIGPVCQMLVDGDRITLFSWKYPFYRPLYEVVRMDGTFTDAELLEMGFTETHLQLVQAARLGEEQLRKAFEAYWDRPFTEVEERWMWASTGNLVDVTSNV